MTILVETACVAAGINVVLLAALIGIWGRNYLRIRSKHTLGLTVFAALLLAENALGLYYYMIDPTLSIWFATEVPVVAWRALVALHVFETAAIGFLVWITWD